MMFEYEKTDNKKWPWRVTAIAVIDIWEFIDHNFSFPKNGKLFEFYMPTDYRCQKLFIYAGYAWDGCSGPVPTTVRSARASCVHDVLYQCMREGLLDQSCRAIADKIFYRLLLEDGMPGWIAWGYYMAVRIFGAGCAKR